MIRTAKLGVWAVTTTMFVIGVLWAGGLLDVPQALGEYLRPTSVAKTYIPEGCIETRETPPANLMRIVEDQKNLYQLTLQKIVVCRSALRIPQFEQRFPGLPNSELDPCRRLSKGCCSCQFGRHVIVEAADPTGTGSVLVGASLIQSRWDYLRLRWNRTRRAPWFWWWPLTGALLLALALRSVLGKARPSVS